MSLHADKYNDPRVKITVRGVLCLVLVAIFAVGGAIGSIYARRTRTEKTKEFWGGPTVTALQLADRVSMMPSAGEAWGPVELTATPGLGHLRKALLHQDHYVWESEKSISVSKSSETESQECVRLRFADPTGKRVPVTEIDIHLATGWVGPSDGSKSVRVNERVQPALKYQLELLRNVKQKSYDLRDTPNSEG